MYSCQVGFTYFVLSPILVFVFEIISLESPTWLLDTLRRAELTGHAISPNFIHASVEIWRISNNNQNGRRKRRKGHT